MQLKQLREELVFTKEMVDLVDMLKNIAAAQFHQMLKDKVRFNDFMDAFAEFFRVVNLCDVKNPLVAEAPGKKGIIIVTSDSGFMGGLNQVVCRAAFEALGDWPREKTAFILLGEKGKNLLDSYELEYKAFKGIDRDAIYEQAVEIKDYCVKEVLEGRMASLMVAHPVALSFSSQTVRMTDILPCGHLFDERTETEVSIRTRGQRFLEEMRKVIVESSFSDLAEYLSGVWATSKLFEVFEDSKLAEYSARAMHLEGSVHKLEERDKKYRHMFFRASHEKIDKGMRDSFSATKVNKKKRKRKKKAAA